MALKAVPNFFKNFVNKTVIGSSHRIQTFKFHRSSCKLKICYQEQEQFYTRLARGKDHDTVMQIMSDTFLKFEPSIVNLGLSGGEIPALKQMITKGMKEGMTIVAVRNEDESIVGAAINTGSCPWSGDHLLRYAECCQSGRIKDLLKFFSYIGTKPQLYQKYNVNKIFECTYVTVANDYQGNGLAKRMIRDSWYLARDCGYRLFRIDCTSRYSAKIAESFGWECVNSLSFEDYKPNGEQIFKNIQEPHTIVTTFVDQLRFCKDYCEPYPKCKKWNNNSKIP